MTGCDVEATRHRHRPASLRPASTRSEATRVSFVALFGLMLAIISLAACDPSSSSG